MGLKYGIDIESMVTVDCNCYMSCEVMADEVQFIFGRINDGLCLSFDWAALLKFVRMMHVTMNRMQTESDSRKAWFMVSADDRSRDAHAPNGSLNDRRSASRPG